MAKHQREMGSCLDALRLMLQRMELALQEGKEAEEAEAGVVAP